MPYGTANDAQLAGIIGRHISISLYCVVRAQDVATVIVSKDSFQQSLVANIDGIYFVIAWNLVARIDEYDLAVENSRLHRVANAGYGDELIFK